jgi:hypothetical protein
MSAIKRTGLQRSDFKTTRPRKDSRRALKDDLDRIFSLFIRLRDGSCVLCGSTQNLECSHFHGRGNPALRFHPLNAHACCQSCNQAHNDNREPYTKFYLRLYGQNALNALEEINRDYHKADDSELLEQIKIFTDLVEILKDERSYL